MYDKTNICIMSQVCFEDGFNDVRYECDSEDDIDENWRQVVSHRLIDDFEDISGCAIINLLSLTPK